MRHAECGPREVAEPAAQEGRAASKIPKPPVQPAARHRDFLKLPGDSHRQPGLRIAGLKSRQEGRHAPTQGAPRGSGVEVASLKEVLARLAEGPTRQRHESPAAALLGRASHQQLREAGERLVRRSGHIHMQQTRNPGQPANFSFPLNQTSDWFRCQAENDVSVQHTPFTLVPPGELPQGPTFVLAGCLISVIAIFSWKLSWTKQIRC
ncbi:protein IL-40 [Eubalaena glacialis]|uniref:protein IL-40 n=1 Tax=Eubalaena glacialis TaxID=27606 RepID=UPI002A5A4A82|nr:protein IL-40 [Eubalaena glacialis]